MRRLAPSLLVVVIALAAALVWAPSAGAATTRTEFVAQAEPICGLANDDIARLNQRFHRQHAKGRYRAAGQTLKKTGTRLSASIDQVRAITPPPGDEGTIADWLGLIEKVALANERMGRAEANENFRVELRIKRQGLKIAVRAHKKVGDWGFHACVR
jgi:hypothetical protein